MHKMLLALLAASFLAGCTTGFEPVDVAAAPADPTVGAGNLTVFLYEDYQCSHCNVYAIDGGYQHLLDTWVAPGHVTVVFKHVAFVGPYSEPAAVASRCVYGAAPQHWGDYDHAIYAQQRTGWQPTPGNLAELAANHGVSEEVAAQCIAVGDDAITGHTDELRDMGRGTPTIVIDGIGYNAAEREDVDGAIEAALA